MPPRSRRARIRTLEPQGPEEREHPLSYAFPILNRVTTNDCMAHRYRLDMPGFTVLPDAVQRPYAIRNKLNGCRCSPSLPMACAIWAPAIGQSLPK